MKVTADYREKPSGIIDLMIQAGIHVSVEKMAYGDYIVNDRVTIERKTATDFILSLIDGRSQSQPIRDPRSLVEYSNHILHADRLCQIR